MSNYWQVRLLSHGILEKYGKHILASSSQVAIIDKRQVFIVDPGEWSRPGTILSFLEEIDRSQIQLTVINTHLHHDHCLSNYLCQADTLIYHTEEKFTIEQYPSGFVEMVNGHSDVRTIERPIRLVEGIQIIETPGHTPGSMSVLVQTASGTVAIAGDAMISKRLLLQRTFSLPEIPQLGELCFDKRQALSSMDRILASADIVIPGHDIPFETKKYRR